MSALERLVSFDTLPLIVPKLTTPERSLPIWMLIDFSASFIVSVPAECKGDWDQEEGVLNNIVHGQGLAIYGAKLTF